MFQSFLIYSIIDKAIDGLEASLVGRLSQPDRRMWIGRRFKSLHRAGRDDVCDEIFTDGTIGKYVDERDFYFFTANDQSLNCGVVTGIHLNDIISVDWF